MIYIYIYIYICRDNGPKSICWALTLSEEAQWFEDRPTVRKTWDFELHDLVITGKVGKGRPRRRSPQLNKGGVKRCVQLSRVMFQEVLLIKIYTMNIQDKWELRNI